MTPTRDDFVRWRDDPVTRWVMRAHAQLAVDNQREWMNISWGNGVANQAALSELRTRADAYDAIRETPYDAYCVALGETPRED